MNSRVNMIETHNNMNVLLSSSVLILLVKLLAQGVRIEDILACA